MFVETSFKASGFGSQHRRGSNVFDKLLAVGRQLLDADEEAASELLKLKASSYSGVHMNAPLQAGSAGIPARHERDSAKMKKRLYSISNGCASLLSVLAHALAGRDARAPRG
jgi:hypothetical protein